MVQASGITNAANYWQFGSSYADGSTANFVSTVAAAVTAAPVVAASLRLLLLLLLLLLLPGLHIA